MTPGMDAIVSHAGYPSAQSVLINEGVGVEDIVVGKSTMSDVIAAYGDDFGLIEHNKYSYEIMYEERGLSFYYRYDDSDKRIFAIVIKPPCHGFTNRGIVVCHSTLRDVFNAYGKAKAQTTTAEETWSYEYEGVIFHTKFDSFGETEKAKLKKKIVGIEVVDNAADFSRPPASNNSMNFAAASCGVSE